MEVETNYDKFVSSGLTEGGATKYCAGCVAIGVVDFTAAGVFTVRSTRTLGNSSTVRTRSATMAIEKPAMVDGAKAAAVRPSREAKMTR